MTNAGPDLGIETRVLALKRLRAANTDPERLPEIDALIAEAVDAATSEALRLAYAKARDNPPTPEETMKAFDWIHEWAHTHGIEFGP